MTEVLSRLGVLVRKTNLGQAAGSATEAAENLTGLIDMARKSVYIVCGQLNSDVYCDQALIKAVRRAKSEPRNVAFHVLVGPGWEAGCPEMKALLEDSTSVATRRPPIHFAVVDGRHVRYEGTHRAEEPVPPNDVLYNAPQTASKLVRIYYTLIADDEVVTLSEIEAQDCLEQ